MHAGAVALAGLHLATICGSKGRGRNGDGAIGGNLDLFLNTFGAACSFRDGRAVGLSKVGAECFEGLCIGLGDDTLLEMEGHGIPEAGSDTLVVAINALFAGDFTHPLGTLHGRILHAVGAGL